MLNSRFGILVSFLFAVCLVAYGLPLRAYADEGYGDGEPIYQDAGDVGPDGAHRESGDVESVPPSQAETGEVAQGSASAGSDPVAAGGSGAGNTLDAVSETDDNLGDLEPDIYDYQNMFDNGLNVYSHLVIDDVFNDGSIISTLSDFDLISVTYYLANIVDYDSVSPDDLILLQLCTNEMTNRGYMDESSLYDRITGIFSGGLISDQPVDLDNLTSDGAKESFLMIASIFGFEHVGASNRNTYKFNNSKYEPYGIIGIIDLLYARLNLTNSYLNAYMRVQQSALLDGTSTTSYYNLAQLSAFNYNKLYRILEQTTSTNSNLVSMSNLLSTGFNNLKNYLQTSYSMNGVTAGTYGVGLIAALQYNKLYDINQVSHQNNALLSAGFKDIYDSLNTSFAMNSVTSGNHHISTIAALIYNKTYDLVEQGKTLSTFLSSAFETVRLNMSTSFKMQGVTEGTYGVGIINALQYNQLYVMRANSQTALSMNGVTAGTYGVGTISALQYNKLYDLVQQGKTLSTFLSKAFDDVLKALTGLEVIAPDIKFEGISELSELLTQQNNLTSKGFDDILKAIKNVGGDGSSQEPSSDLDTVIGKLDEIIRLQQMALTADLVESIIGDLSFDNMGAVTGAVSSALQSAFPFCVPAILKQVLGLLQYEAAPPAFHFEFWGAPLDFDFSDFQGLADVTCWLCRILFLIGLLINSKQFIFAGGSE